MGDLNRLSHLLSRILRHAAVDRDLDISSEGYVDIDAFLDLPEAACYTLADVERVVLKDSKGRFKIREHCGVKQIKATQGHSMTLDDPHKDMEPIRHWTEAQFVIHGTRRRNLDSIKATGLSRKGRSHIHFATGETNVKSGMPGYCDTVVELDIKKAMEAGFKFYKSENGVILCTGDAHGFIPKRYFKKIYDRRTRSPISME